jgi:hypothetical protein
MAVIFLNSSKEVVLPMLGKQREEFENSEDYKAMLSKYGKPK